MDGEKIKAKIVIELQGSPKGHVEETIRLVVDKLKVEDDVKLLREVTYKAEEIPIPPEVLESLGPDKDKVKPIWSVFSDIDIEVASMKKLIDVCFDYMPSSVEIVSPDRTVLTSYDCNYLLNEVLAQLHQSAYISKNLAAENVYLKESMKQKS